MMSATRLVSRTLEKVWGRCDLAPWFPNVPPGKEPVGEVWFETPDGRDVELLVKFLFTSEKLSIQVHPDGPAAAAAGLPRGKDEAWVVLDAAPGATIGIGLKHPVGRDVLRAAALDGSLESLVDWRTVSRGDAFYSTAGTIHAIGPGLAIIEVQQNLDLTYRLFDYGRSRELHLDAGVAVARPEPFGGPCVPRQHCEVRTVLAEGAAFTLERWVVSGAGRIEAVIPLWLVVPDKGAAWLLDGPTDWDFGTGTEAIVAYAEPTARKNLWTPA